MPIERIQVLFACVLICAALSSAEESWVDFKAGDEVVIVRTDGTSLGGTLKEISTTELKLKVKFATMSIPRAEVASISRPTSEEETPAKDKPKGGDEEVKPESSAGAAVEFEYGDGKRYAGKAGDKLDITVSDRASAYTAVILEKVDAESVYIKRYGMSFAIALKTVEEVQKVGGASSAPNSGDPGSDDGSTSPSTSPDVGESSESPPEVGAQVRLLPKGDSEFARGTVTEVDDQRITIETLDGPFSFAWDEVEAWQLTGVAVGYLQLSRLMRHYAINTDPSWASRFLAKGGIDRANAELEALSNIRVKPSPTFIPGRVLVAPAKGEDVAFERNMLMTYYEHMRVRYLEISEFEMGYFFQRNFLDEDKEKEIRKTFQLLKKEKPGKEIEGERLSKISTLINNRFKEMADEIRELESQRTPTAEIDAAKARLASHTDSSTRLSDALDKYEHFRRLAFMDADEIEKGIHENWNKTFGKLRDELASTNNGSLRERIRNFDMPRPSCTHIELTDKGRDDLNANLKAIVESDGVRKVVFEDEEWLFNRALRQLTATLVPSRDSFAMMAPGGSSDRGFAGVYHMNVYLFDGAEICRMALFRVEPGLHVRILLHKDRLVFCDAEEWIF